MWCLIHSTISLLMLSPSMFVANPVEKCDQPLGIEEGTLLPERSRTISRHNNYEDGPEYARLNRKEQPPGYRAKKNDSMGTKSVTVFLDGETIITGIATQGYGDPEVKEWVEGYSLIWREERAGKEMNRVLNQKRKVIFQGNADFNSIVRNDFGPVFPAKEFTIEPRTVHNNVGLRFELYGCKDLTIRCTKEKDGKIQNCSERAMKGERLTFKAHLRLSTPENNVSYKWSLYKMTPRGQWEKVQYREEDARKEKFIIVKDDLESDKNYRVNLTTTQGKKTTSTSSYDFAVNSAPKEGSCWTETPKGYALQTVFKFKCEDWVDMDRPLKYEFSYKTKSGLSILLGSSKNNSISTRLAAGDPKIGHRVTVNVLILDSQEETANTNFSVEVENGNVTSLLRKFAGPRGNLIADLLENRKASEAVILANVVLTTMSYAGENVKIEEKKTVKNKIIKHMRRVSVSDLQDVLLMASVVAGVTEKRNELSEEAQKTSVDILENITHVYSREMRSSSTGEKRMADSTAKNLLHGIANVLEKQSKDAEDKSKNMTNVKAIVDRVWNLVPDVGDGLLVRKKVGDKPLELKTKSVSMLLARQDPKRLGKEPFEAGESKVSFPPSNILLENIGGETPSVDIQLLTMKSNPFSWDPSAENVKTSILSVHLRNGSHALKISNLSQDIQLNIESGNKAVKQLVSFAKPRTAERMQRHEIKLLSSHMTLQIRIEPESGRSLRVYIRHRYPPTMQQYDFEATVPDFSCAEQKEAEHLTGQESTSKPTGCKDDPNLISVSSNITGHLGIHYIGVVVDDEGSDLKERTRRSCFENGREKRSADCLQVKDPPTPTPSIIRPKYDPTTDVKYNISVTIATCLYLSENGKWTTEGCKVGNSHGSGSLQCLCNHLSSFGGNLIVEPNPLDFDKVWAGFKNMGGDNNVVVITVVFALFGLWVIVVVFARRADTFDEKKVTPPIMLSSKCDKDHCYEIKIYTGVWRRCGTTANVAIILCGDNYDTSAIPLTYNFLSNKRLFGRGCINSFILPLKESLGDVGHIRIWHDNTGANPQWFVRQVMIRDICNDTEWAFVCNRWLAAERDDGKIERVFHASSSEEVNSFKNKFWTRASTGITDGHLWLSVISRLPTSSFTRVQRASCCLCLLLTVLVVNAMFYSSDKEQTHTIQIGPLVMGLRQVVIGIQSSLIIVPVNLLIVGIFRNVKPPHYTSSKEYDTSGQKDTSKPTRGLPHVFLYFAWALCLVTSVSAGTFTVFYSMAWGTEKSNEWLVSILVSFSQDIVFIQPVKVVIIASLLSTLIKKAPEDESLQHLKPLSANLRENEGQSVTPPKGPELLRFRQYRLRVFKMSRVIIETIVYLTFAWALMAVCYGTRDKSHFLMTKGLQNVLHNKVGVFLSYQLISDSATNRNFVREVFFIFRSLERVTNLHLFWNWTLKILVPGLYNTTWYNNREFEYEEGFISNRVGYMVGMPRLRQLRVKPVPCLIETQQPEFVRSLPKCLPAYSFRDEDTSKYNSPGWRKFTENFTTCPKPWLYRDSGELNNLPYEGKRSWYGGGGYVADLGYTPGEARVVVKELLDSKWIDEHTRAVFMEVTIYEPANSLFSAVTYLYEVQPTGHGMLTSKIKTMSLYAAQASGTQSFFAICELIVFISVIYFLMAQAIKMYRMRCKYFKSVWSWIELAQILVASVTVILSNFRRYHTSKLVAKIHENPFETSSFHYAVWWSDMENVFMAVLIFIVTVKLLGILKLNQHIFKLAGIMKNCTGQLASYALVYFVAFLAFLQFAILCFGTSVSYLSSVTEVFRTQFSLIIGGKIDHDELFAASPLFGSFYFSSFMIVMGTIFVHLFLAILNESYTCARVSQVSGDPEQQDTVATFLDYAKKRLSDKVSKLRKKKLLPKSKQYDVEGARATDPTPTTCRYTDLDWLEDAPRAIEDQGLNDEDTVLQDVKHRMRSIWLSIHGYRRSKKYEVHKYETANLNETSKRPKEQVSFKCTLYQAKTSSTSLLNIGASCKGTSQEDTNTLLSEESEDDFEYEFTASCTGSETSWFRTKNFQTEELAQEF